MVKGFGSKTGIPWLLYTTVKNDAMRDTGTHTDTGCGERGRKSAGKIWKGIADI